MVGSGLPSALQFRVTGSFLATIMSDGCSVMRGDRYCPVNQERNIVNATLNNVAISQFTYPIIHIQALCKSLGNRTQVSVFTVAGLEH